MFWLIYSHHHTNLKNKKKKSLIFKLQVINFTTRKLQILSFKTYNNNSAFKSNLLFIIMIKSSIHYHGQFKTCTHFIATLTDTFIHKKFEFHVHLTLSNDGMKHTPVQNFVLSFSYICNN